MVQPDGLHLVVAVGEDGGTEEPTAGALPLHLHPLPAALEAGALLHSGVDVAQDLGGVCSTVDRE